MTQHLLVIIAPVAIVASIFAPLIWYEIKQRKRQVETDTKVLSSFYLQQKRGQEHERLVKFFNKNPLFKALLEYAITRHNIILRAHPQGKEASENDWGFTPKENVMLVPEKILEEYNQPNSKIKDGIPEMLFATEIGHIEHYKTGKLVTKCPNVRKRDGRFFDCYYNELAAAAVAGDIMGQLTKDTKVSQGVYENTKKLAKHQCSQCFPVISRGECPKKQTIARMEEKLKDFFKK